MDGINGLKSAYTHLGYEQFCLLMGFDLKWDGAKDKFRALSQIAEGLGQFDDDRLSRLASYRKEMITNKG